MKYHTATTPQMIVLGFTVGVTAAMLVCCFILFMDYRLLPMVHRDTDGTCIKVDNFENGHAFNCSDVDVILRRYRTPNDKEISSTIMHRLQEKS